jgi:hypothetical protein
MLRTYTRDRGVLEALKMNQPRKPRWWQYNPEKLKATVEEAKRVLGAARHGPRGRALRPFHPDHDDWGGDLGPGDDGGFAPAPVGGGAVQARLQQLRNLYDQGLISAQDYEARKGEILREV